MRTFTQYDINQAREKGLTAGRAEAATEQAAAIATATAAGEKKGADAAYARMTTILADKNIKGRERAVLSLACASPNMSMEDVCALVADMGASPRSGSLDERMANGGGAPLDFETKAVNTEPDFVARMKTRHGVASA